MDVSEAIADRRITEARDAGFFDNLAGKGQPIPDLHRERPPGWWGARVVGQERSKIKAEKLDRTTSSAMPGVWRLGSETEVRDRVRELNEAITDYNRVTTWEHRTTLDTQAIVELWHRFRSGSSDRA